MKFGGCRITVAMVFSPNPRVPSAAGVAIRIADSQLGPDPSLQKCGPERIVSRDENL